MVVLALRLEEQLGGSDEPYSLQVVHQAVVLMRLCIHRLGSLLVLLDLDSHRLNGWQLFKVGGLTLLWQRELAIRIVSQVLDCLNGLPAAWLLQGPLGYIVHALTKHELRRWKPELGHGIETLVLRVEAGLLDCGLKIEFSHELVDYLILRCNEVLELDVVVDHLVLSAFYVVQERTHGAILFVLLKRKHRVSFTGRVFEEVEAVLGGAKTASQNGVHFTFSPGGARLNTVDEF